MKILLRAAMFQWVCMVYVISAVWAQPEQESRQALEANVANILAQDNVSQRGSIDQVFQLADVYAQEGNVSEAIRLYEAGLQVDSWRWESQFKLSRLLHGQERKDEAVEKARQVIEYAEDPRLVEEGRTWLSSLGMVWTESSPPAPAESPDAPELVLVRQWLLEEVQPELQRALGVQITIAPYDLELGAVDRNDADRLVRILATQLQDAMPAEERQKLLASLKLSEADLSTADGRQRFVEGAMRAELSPEDYQQFQEKLAALSHHGQYETERLLRALKMTYPSAGSSKVLGYLGVTEEDLTPDFFL